MGCASSHLLEDDNDDYYSHMGSAFSHHIVSLTSTTYGLLTLDSPHRPPTPPEPLCRPSEPEVINSWELMAGLDNDSFRFSPASKPPRPLPLFNNKENREPPSRPACPPRPGCNNILKPANSNTPTAPKHSLEEFEKKCPPGGENAVVIYTTSLRGIRKTFEDCNAVRAAVEGAGVWVRERDVSMHLGFREELRELLKGKEETTVPRVFVKGRYLGGAEEVLRIHEEGCLGKLLEGLPRARAGAVCDGCGGGRFLPCLGCHGSCKKVKEDGEKVFRCPDCNENGLILCPICSWFCCFRDVYICSGINQK